MGKSLKGKELGIGISQRKDGLYTGRYTDKQGKRCQKYFTKLQDCRKWIADAQFLSGGGLPAEFNDMTVDAWFNYWLSEIKGSSIRRITKRNYEARYRHNICNVLGDMPLAKVKPLHCQQVLNLMADRYKLSTIAFVRTIMFSFFENAVENEIISKNPVTKAVKCFAGMESKPKRVLTRAEQDEFLQAAKDSRYFLQYALVLQTGLRSGEIIGLRWNDVDLKRRILHVRRSMVYDYKGRRWEVDSPKSRAGARDIPLTKEAVSILKFQKEKTIGMRTVSIEYANLVFICGNGEPAATVIYDTDLKKTCKRAGLESVSMHALRHTFATRCIEYGMRPKTLQMILGHSNIGMTMDLYVHVTEEEKLREMERIEKRSLSAVYL